MLAGLPERRDVVLQPSDVKWASSQVSRDLDHAPSVETASDDWITADGNW
jgi:hypothetical protein